MESTSLKGLRGGALTLVLVLGAALALVVGATVLPQTAESIPEPRDSRGAWIPIAPSDHYEWRYANRLGDDTPKSVAPGDVFNTPVRDPDFFGPPVREDYGPGVAESAPDTGIPPDID
jgi:hypothetical protein